MKAKGLLTRTSFRPKTASKEWIQRCNRSFKWERRWLVCHTRSYSALEGARCIERFHSRCQHLCKCIGTKGIVYIWKEFNSHRICLEHQHGRRFIVLKHQYGRRRRHVKTLYWAIGRATEGPLVDLSVIPQQQCYAERTLWEVQVHVTQEKQNGRLGFWNLCCIRRTEKKFVHISLLNNSIIHGMRKTEKKKFVHISSLNTSIIHGMSFAFADCPRNINLCVYLILEVTEGSAVPVLVVIWNSYWGLESFCKASHWTKLTLSLPGWMLESLKVLLTFESLDKILWCDHSNETSLSVLSNGAICFQNFTKKNWEFLWNFALGTWRWKR